MKKLVRIDKNGSKHYEGTVACDRCDGAGYMPYTIYNGVCFKCGGTKLMKATWIERTPEYQAKLDARREAKNKKLADERAKKLEADRIAKEKAEAEKLQKQQEREAKKALSQYVGSIGDKIEVKVTYEFTASWEQASFAGYGTETMFLHSFVDANGNKLVWKTSKGTRFEEGSEYTIRATIKAHSEYKGEKQTALIRCKIA